MWNMSAVEVMDENNIGEDGSVEFVEDMSESFVGNDDDFDFSSKKNVISSTDRLKMDGYSAYVSESTRYKLLTPEEELYYGRLSLSGDIKARNILVTHNLRLVVSMARKMHTSVGLSLIDLISHGNVGLITAAEKYDPKAGCRFSTYATYWIFQSLQRAVAKDGRLIRTPVHMIQLQNRIFREE